MVGVPDRLKRAMGALTMNSGSHETPSVGIGVL